MPDLGFAAVRRAGAGDGAAWERTTVPAAADLRAKETAIKAFRIGWPSVLAALVFVPAASASFLEDFGGFDVPNDTALTGQVSGANTWQNAGAMAGASGRLFQSAGLAGASRGVLGNWQEARANAIAIEPGTILPEAGTFVLTADMIDDPAKPVGVGVGTAGLLNNGDNWLYSMLNDSGTNDRFLSRTNGDYVRDADRVKTLARPTGTWKKFRIEVDLNAGGTVTAARQYIDGALAGTWGFGAAPAWKPTHVGFFLGNSGAAIDPAIDNFVYYFGAAAQARPADFGNQWVRTHPFALMSWTTTLSDPGQFLAAGLNTNVSGSGGPIHDGAAAGIPWHFMNNYGVGSFAAHQQDVENLMAMPGNQGRGWYLKDEPDRTQFGGMGQFAAWLRQRTPGMLVYAGAMGNVPSYQLSGDPSNTTYTYEQYLDDYMTIVQPDALMYNNYPNLGQGRRDYDAYFGNLMAVRRKGQQYGVPCFNWVRAEVLRGSPGESEMRWQQFASLTAGYKGLNYFLYQTEVDYSGLVNLNTGQPNDLYAVAAAANAEVANLGRSLRFLESTAVYYVSCSGNPQPQGLESWQAGFDPHVAGISVTSPLGAFTDGLIGFFTDGSGRKYFILTNLNVEMNDAALDSMDFRLLFSGAVDSVLRLNRLTGEPEKLGLNNHELDLTLPGGTGDLFKFNDGLFAGIQPGDTDLDGDVDVSDLETLAAHFGETSGGRWSGGDVDLDGDVDQSDLGVMATHYGGGAAQAFADFAALSSAFLEDFNGFAVPEHTPLTGQASGANTWQNATAMAGGSGALHSTAGLNWASRGGIGNWAEDRANAIAIEAGTIKAGAGTFVVTMDMIDASGRDVGLGVGTAGLLDNGDNWLYSRLNVLGINDLFRSMTSNIYVGDFGHAKTLVRPTQTWKHYRLEVDLNAGSVVTAARQYIDGELAGIWSFGATPVWTPTHVGFMLGNSSGQLIDQKADNFSYYFRPLAPEGMVFVIR